MHPHCILSCLEPNSVYGCVYYHCVVVTLQVLQYKKRSGDMEQQLLEKTSELEKLRLSVWQSKAPTLLFLQLPFTCVCSGVFSMFSVFLCVYL